MKGPLLSTKRSLELYFLDVGQGDAAFIITPNDTKVLVDGGVKDRALGFLIWKYRLDQPGNSVHVDHLIVSHGDADHIRGLIDVLGHSQISIGTIWHNGIAVFQGGAFQTTLGDRAANGDLTHTHNTLAELDGLPMATTFADWITEIRDKDIDYRPVTIVDGLIDLGDPAVTVSTLGPIRQADDASFAWLGSKGKTINGHSVVFGLTFDQVRVLFSGDLNTRGSKHLLAHWEPAAFDAHVFKSPHHGSHDFHQPLFDAIGPQVTVVSSGDSPDYGHPRANFLSAIGLASRSAKALLFSTEIAATFIDAGDAAAVADADIVEPTTLGDLDFSQSSANRVARRRFKKVLPGIINVRTDGQDIYAARRVNAGFQWESYGPIKPVDQV